jgi:hypothetical protein
MHSRTQNTPPKSAFNVMRQLRCNQPVGADAIRSITESRCSGDLARQLPERDQLSGMIEEFTDHVPEHLRDQPVPCCVPSVGHDIHLLSLFSERKKTLCLPSVSPNYCSWHSRSVPGAALATIRSFPLQRCPKSSVYGQHGRSIWRAPQYQALSGQSVGNWASRGTPVRLCLSQSNMQYQCLLRSQASGICRRYGTCVVLISSA